MMSSARASGAASTLAASNPDNMPNSPSNVRGSSAAVSAPGRAASRRSTSTAACSACSFCRTPKNSAALAAAMRPCTSSRRTGPDTPDCNTRDTSSKPRGLAPTR